MSTLSSASTDADVWNAYDDNASFEEDSSPAKAAAFITACRILLRRRPQAMSVGGRMVTFDAKAIRDEMSRATQWLSTNPAAGAGGGGVRYLDYSNLRD